jgi:hypothetical protein
MGMFQLLTSLWPFLKEMFIGEKIQDRAPSGRGGPATPRNNEKETLSAKAARWLLDKMQKSRRFLAFVITLLILSLFINYKTIGKINAMMPREEDKVQSGAPTTKEPKEVPTVPSKDSERDALLAQTVKELNDLYGEGKSR